MTTMVFRTPYQRNSVDGTVGIGSAKGELKQDSATVATKIKYGNQYSISGRIARLGSGASHRTVLTAENASRPVVHRSSARSSPNLLEVETDSKVLYFDGWLYYIVQSSILER